MLEEGYESGCLKVVSNDFELSYNKMLPVITECAEKDWNEFEEWTRHMWGHVYESYIFPEYYELNDEETNLFLNKAPMPKSFVEKYYKGKLKNNPRDIIWHLKEVLYHKGYKNT